MSASLLSTMLGSIGRFNIAAGQPGSVRPALSRRRHVRRHRERVVLLTSTPGRLMINAMRPISIVDVPPAASGSQLHAWQGEWDLRDRPRLDFMQAR
ncbi:hypothetical protein [Xylella taiwanensis]|uniref:hypothetical protein n=1 Tax=Xylella taiwanensis TaxID=1444770 RepID=UPI001E63B393|nr:hypothetical protein [Xylella taiwanensis]MCD8465742.1 hypothetical protein [Xylella taiwanensis]